MVTPDTFDAPLHPPGTIIGRYRLVRTLGEGGMGSVYEAVHVDLGKRVAMKVLRPEVARVAESRARFLREGRTAASIHHAHVVEVFDVGQEGGALYLVMEYLEGENLYEHLYRVGVLPVAECVDLLLPVCAALAVAHEQGIVHRDVKPENVFLARSRHGALQSKLLDFGISKVPLPNGARLTATSTLLGTPHYMSPEQAQEGGRVDARSDQYAFGVMLYECSTGKRPFEGDDLYPLLHAIVRGDSMPPRAVRPELSPAFEALVQRAMAVDPAGRFPSMHALGAALLPFASPATQEVWRPVFGAAPVVDPPTAAPRPRPATTTLAETPSPPRRRRAFVAGCVVGLVLIGTALAATRRPSPPPARPRPPAAAPVTALVAAP
ncbi:MAG: Serine/threonine protein kinase PrkC, regulator of stationary phase, partial [Myxococcaceae bacterium]|nr:Serine/threonine protein kinase PrkC, regulator of stationary phase [Myxococcaceae bacterium]